MEFVINMTDDSMAPFLFTGDVVKVRSSYEAEDGYIVAALVSDEATQTTSVLVRKVALGQNTVSRNRSIRLFPHSRTAVRSLAARFVFSVLLMKWSGFFGTSTHSRHPERSSWLGKIENSWKIELAQ